MMDAAPSAPAVQGKRAEIYTYEFNSMVYAMNWSVSGMSSFAARFRSTLHRPK